jgi:histidine ammonia-lyase
VGEALAVVRKTVPALGEDRVLSGDIEAMAAAVRGGKIDSWRS